MQLRHGKPKGEVLEAVTDLKNRASGNQFSPPQAIVRLLGGAIFRLRASGFEYLIEVRRYALRADKAPAPVAAAQSFDAHDPA